MADEEKKVPVEATLLDNLGKIAYTLDRAYLPNLEKEYGIFPLLCSCSCGCAVPGGIAGGSQGI